MPNIMQKEPMNRYPLHNSPSGHPYQRNREEEQRLRRLADVRSVINPHGRRALPPPPVRTMKEPPMPQGFGESASTPSLHDFATRTHLARLDIAYEKLDAFVEQSVLQLQSGVQEQIDKLREWVETKMGASEEKLAEAFTTVQSTRSVLDSAVSSLSAAQGGKNGVDDLRARIASCEERLLASATNSAEMRERITALDERCAKEMIGDSPKALVERLRVLEVLWGTEILVETAPKALTERFKELEERMSSMLEERLAAKTLEDEAPKATDHLEEHMQSNFLSSDVEARVKVLEEHMQSNLELAERLDTVSGHVNQCKTALEFAVGDLAERFSDQSITKDMNYRVDDARYNTLQEAINNIRAVTDAISLEQLAIKGDLEASFTSKVELKKLQEVSEDLKLRQESVSTILAIVAQRLQVAFDGEVESEDQKSDVTMLSEDARLKSFEVALSKMASSVSGLEQKLAGGGVGDVAERFSDHNLEASFASKAEFEELKAVSEDLKLWQESVSTILANVAQRLQVAFDGEVESEDQKSDVTMLSEDARLKSFEVALSKMASSVSGLEQRLAGGVVGDLAERLSDQSVTKDMNGRIDDVRYDNLQDSINGVRAVTDAMRLEQLAIKDDLEASFTRKTEFEELKAVSEDLKLWKESVSTILATVAQRLQVAFNWQVESENQESDATMLSEDARLKSFETALSKMASSFSGLEQRLAGGGVGISPQDFFDLRVRVDAGFQAMIVRMESARYVNEQEDRVGDAILQRFIYTMDERIKELQAHVNKNGHYVEKLMTKAGLKIKRLPVNSRCDCGAEFNPDYEACINCGKPWKAHLHEALKMEHEHNRLKKYARQFLQNKDYERKGKLVFVAFDIWARGSEAKSLKCYSEAHPRDHRIAYQSRVATTIRSTIAMSKSQQFEEVVSSGGDSILAHKEETLAPQSRRTPPSSIGDSAFSPVSQSLLSPVKEAPRNKFLSNPGSRSVGSLPRLQEQA